MDALLSTISSLLAGILPVPFSIFFRLCTMHFSSFLVAALATVALTSPIKEKRVKNFKFFGVNVSGGEWGADKIPGKLGTDYMWPSTSSIDVCPYTLAW